MCGDSVGAVQLCGDVGVPGAVTRQMVHGTAEDGAQHPVSVGPGGWLYSLIQEVAAP